MSQPLPSRRLLEGKDRAAARAMLKGIGFDDMALAQPQVMVSHSWIETMPCNYNQRDLAAAVKEGVRAAGGTPMEVNTIAISAGVTMGTEGMKTSLVSRELIADSIELVARGHYFDALCCIVGCDKTIPAGAMALARVDRPGIVLYSGSIGYGTWRGRNVAIADTFEASGAEAAGRISATAWKESEDATGPGAGHPGSHRPAEPQGAVARASLSVSRSTFPKRHQSSNFSNSNWSPRWVPVASSVPAGSSSTECASRLSAIRLLTMLGRILRILYLRFRNTTSMVNFIANVCMPSQGTIHSPSPGARPVCFNNPVRRLALVSAISARAASMRPRV